jgi:hypothetical protein
MGDNDNETLENVRVGTFDFDDDAFDEISEEAKDFIQKLLVKDKRYTASGIFFFDHQLLADICCCWNVYLIFLLILENLCGMVPDSRLFFK